ncbi:TauD/TfdA family dioxygenase [Denitrobaculum tricleocarpae]|uniref:TauD/TfdA family dioxygenase n=1 Tax=Denitrobaculum tricleocarpae TaxID=2591009 RepID=UPI0015D225DB|nr:TauD/TfdA family dioxygenase [Denitrobaculum tricleocarpae]
MQHSEPRLAKLEPRDEGLSLQWGDGQETMFPWFWLRDHGQDEASLDPDTLQRRVDTFEISHDIRGLESRLLDEGAALEIAWQSSSTPSRYSADFLAVMAGLVPSGADLAPQVPRRLWSKCDPLEVPSPLAHDDVLDSKTGLQACLERVHALGFAVVEGVPTDDSAIERFLTRIGYVRTTIFGGLWTLSAEVRDHDDTAYSQQYLEPHTDGTYSHDAPGLQSFVCREFDGSGGESILVDGFALAEEMRREAPDHFETLCSVVVPGRYIEPGVHLRAERPAFLTQADGALRQISFNNYDRAPFSLPPDRMTAFYAAYRDFHARIIERANWLTIPLRPGMALVFDNWRLLHGRMGYSGKRVFCGCYHNHEDFESALRTVTAEAENSPGPN